LNDLLLIYLSRYLNQETATKPFRSSSQAATYYYQSNYSKLETIPLKCLVQVHNKRTCWPISTLILLNAEHQVGKLQILTFYVLVWFGQGI